jgi:hypothetical protein
MQCKPTRAAAAAAEEEEEEAAAPSLRPTRLEKE